MVRKLITFVFAALAAGCGQQDAATSKNSPAPAYVAPSDAPSQAATDDGQHAVADTATDTSSDLTASDEQATTDADRSAASDEAMAEDEVSPDDRLTTKDEEPDRSDEPTDRRPDENEPASASADDLSASSSARGPKVSTGKLFRGLTNSLRRAASKTYAELKNQTPPPEDDPFPNGEPADADPNSNR